MARGTGTSSGTTGSQGELTYRVEGDRTPPKPGLNTFRLGLMVDGAVFTTVPVVVRLTIEAPVYVSTQQLNRHQELNADVVRQEVRNWRPETNGWGN